MRQNGERADPQEGPARNVKIPAKDSNASSIRDLAVTMAERGWHVFPCGTPAGGSHSHAPGQGGAVDCERCKAEKAPRRGWKWKERNTADPVVVRQHWPADGPNIGVACLRSRLVVIDLDTVAHGGTLPEEWRIPGVNDGADVFAHLLERRGEGWPSTYSVRTASGGWHLYYQAISGRPIPNSAGKVGPMIDVRGDGNADGTPGGGYVLGVGSSVGGARYEVIDDSPPQPLPAWLADLADPPRPARPAGVSTRPAAPAMATARPRTRFVGLLDAVLNAAPGQRNNVLHWAASRAAEMVRDGHVEQHAAASALAQAAEAIGLGDREAQATIRSAFGRAA